MTRRVIVVVAAIAAVFATAAGTQEPQAPPLDAALVSTGAAVYAQYCASCHGTAGQAAPGWQQPNAAGELPPPPHDETGHTWRHADGALYGIVMEGWRDPFNRTDRLTMPPFAGVLSPQDARAVLTYLKTLWTEDQMRFQVEQSLINPFPPDAR